MAKTDMARRPAGWTPEWLTVRDIAADLHVSEDTVRRWIRTERIVAKYFGGRIGYRITRTDLQQFLRHSRGHPKRRSGGMPTVAR